MWLCDGCPVYLLQALMDVDGNGRISQEELLSTAKSVLEAEKYMRAASAAAASSMRGASASASTTQVLPEVGYPCQP
jgi:hypothetical protein